MPSKAALAARPRKPLTLKQRVFVSAVTNPASPTFGNQTQAYLASHPTASYDTAKTEGSVSLANPNVRAEIEAELSAWGYDKTRLEHELGKNMRLSWSQGKTADHRAAIETLAKLRGDWTDKSRIESLTSDDENTIRRLVLQTLQAASVPTPSNGHV